MNRKTPGTVSTVEDGRSQIKLRAQEQTVWMTQWGLAELFAATKQNISLHLKNVFEDGELDPAATVKESLTVQTEGSREVQRPVTLYNLNAILAVGYRVRSPRGLQLPRLGVAQLTRWRPGLAYSCAAGPQAGSVLRAG